MFNEEEVIASSIQAVVAELESLSVDWELLLVNDGSTDNTVPICREAAQKDPRIRLVDYSPNRGRGYALRSGFQAARGGKVITIDADLTYSPEHITRIWKELEKNEADIIIGSPYMKGGRTINVPFSRLLISRLGNLFLSFSFPGKIKTITCVLRGYRGEVLDSLDLESDGKEIHLEILSKAISVGFRTKEIPATLKGRLKGSSKFKFRSTSISHLLFSFYQKPMMIFGLLGLLMTGWGVILGIYFIILRYSGRLNPTRPLSFLMILLILGGIQMLSFGFIANQIGVLKKEIFKIQKTDKLIRKKLDETRE
jgi:glycosyltransferase involved in cell wall biosynthesis